MALICRRPTRGRRLGDGGSASETKNQDSTTVPSPVQGKKKHNNPMSLPGPTPMTFRTVKAIMLMAVLN